MVAPRWLGAFFLSLGNVRMQHLIEISCNTDECLTGETSIGIANVASFAEIFQWAESLDKQNIRARVGEGMVSFLVGDYRAALVKFSDRTQWQNDPILMGRALEAAWRIDDAKSFLEIFTSELLPEVYRQRYRAVAAKYYADLAARSATIADREQWLGASLKVWPDNLCALSVGVVLAGEGKMSAIAEKQGVEAIHQRAFDGAFASNPLYQACLIEWLPRLVAVRPTMLPTVMDVIGRWLWLEENPYLSRMVKRLIQISPSSKLNVLLGDTYMATGDWQAAQMAFQVAAEMSTEPQRAQAYYDLAQTLPAISEFMPDQVSYMAASNPDSLDVLWTQYQQSRESDPMYAVQTMSTLRAKLRMVFKLPKELKTNKIEDTDLSLGGWYIETNQLEFSRRITVWLLVGPMAGQSLGSGKNWIELDGWRVVRLDEVNVIPNAGFEVGAGVGPFVPWGYTSFENNKLEGVTIVDAQRGDHVSQALMLGRSGLDSGTVVTSLPQQVRPGHLYMFVGWVRAQNLSASGYGALAACRWLNADGVVVGYHEFLQGYSHMDWQDHINFTNAPQTANWCKMILINNDPMNLIWFDDLMLVDINQAIAAMQ